MKWSKNDQKCKNAAVGDVRRDQTWSKLLASDKSCHIFKKMHLLGMFDVTRHGQNYLLRVKVTEFLKN
jgi:hypothetical protein